MSDPEAFLSRLESEVGPVAQRLVIAKLRPPEPPPSDDIMPEHIVETLVPTPPRSPPISAGTQRPQRANSQSLPDHVISVETAKALHAVAEAHHAELQATKEVLRDTQSELKEAQRRIAEFEALEQSQLAGGADRAREDSC